MIDVVDADGITLRNFEVVSDKQEMRLVDVRNLLFENLSLDLCGKELQTEISGEMTRHHRFENCTPQIR